MEMKDYLESGELKQFFLEEVIDEFDGYVPCLGV